MMILADKKHKGSVARVIQQAGSGWMHGKLKSPKIVIIIKKKKRKRVGAGGGCLIFFPWLFEHIPSTTSSNSHEWPLEYFA